MFHLLFFSLNNQYSSKNTNTRNDIQSYIVFAGNKTKSSSIPFVEEWTQKRGFHFLNMFNPAENWLYRKYEDDSKTIKEIQNIHYFPGEIPFFFFNDTSGEAELLSNSDEEIRETIGYLPEYYKLFISNTNQESYSFTVDSGRKPSIYIISYSEPVDVNISHFSTYSQDVIQVNVSTPGQFINLNSSYASVVLNHVDSILVSGYSKLSNFNIQIDTLSSISTNSTFPFNGFINDDNMTLLNVSENQYKIQAIDNIQSFNVPTVYEIKQKNGFHFPIQFPNRTHRWNYSHYLTPTFDKINKTNSIKYTSASTPFYYFGDSYGKIESYGENENVKERIGTLPNSERYFIFNDPGDEVESSCYNQGGYNFECVSLYSFTNPTTINFSFTHSTSSYPYCYLKTHFNDMELYFNKSKSIIISNITDLLIELECNNYVYQYITVPSFTFTKINGSIDSPTYPFKSEIKKDDLNSLSDIPSSYIFFSGNKSHSSLSPINHTWNFPFGFHFLTQFDKEQHWIYDQYNESYRTTQNIKYFDGEIPFFYMENLNGSVKLSEESEREEVISETVGTIPYCNTLFISNTNENKYFFDYSTKQSYGFQVLISYSEPVDISVDVDLDYPSNISIDNDFYTLRKKSITHFSHVTSLLLFIRSGFFYQSSFVNITLESEKPKSSPTFPINGFYYSKDFQLVNYSGINQYPIDSLYYDSESTGNVTHLISNTNGFHLPFSFHAGTRWNYSHYLSSAFNEPIKNNSVKYNQATYPIYYFGNNYGKITTSSKGYDILEKIGTLPICDYYHFSNSQNVFNHSSETYRTSFSKAYLISYSDQISFDLEYDSKDCDLNAYIGDTTYNLYSSHTIKFTNISDILLVENCNYVSPYYYYYYCYSSSFAIKNISGNTHDPTIPLNRTFTREELESINGNSMFIRAAGSYFQTYQKPLSYSFVNTKGYHFINYISKDSDKTVFEYKLYSDSTFYRTRKVKYLYGSIPFAFLNSFTGNLSISGNTGDCEFVETIGYLPNNFYCIYISNTNNETYIFNSSNLNYYTRNNYCILISYSNPVDVNISFENCNGLNVSADTDLYNISANENITFTNINSLFICKKDGFSRSFRIKIQRTKSVYRSPTYPYNGEIIESQMNEIEYLGKSNITTVDYSGDTYESNFDEIYGFQFLNTFNKSTEFQYDFINPDNLKKNKTRKLKYKKSILPFFYFDQFFGKIKANKKSMKFRAVEGVLLARPYGNYMSLYVSNTNNRSYIFNSNTCSSYSSRCTIIVSYSKDADISLHFYSSNAISVSFGDESFSFTGDQNIFCPKVPSVVFQMSYYYSQYFNIVLNQSSIPYKSGGPTFPMDGSYSSVSLEKNWKNKPLSPTAIFFIFVGSVCALILLIFVIICIIKNIKSRPYVEFGHDSDDSYNHSNLNESILNEQGQIFDSPREEISHEENPQNTQQQNSQQQNSQQQNTQQQNTQQQNTQQQNTQQQNSQEEGISQQTFISPYADAQNFQSPYSQLSDSQSNGSGVESPYQNIYGSSNSNYIPI